MRLEDFIFFSSEIMDFYYNPKQNILKQVHWIVHKILEYVHPKVHKSEKQVHPDSHNIYK